MANAYDSAQTLHMCAKRLMAQEAASILGYFIKSDIEMDETVSWMKKTRMIKPVVLSKKGWS
jgi:predicted nucleic acid-binding protein